jgi:hypothetical protein
MKTHPHGQDLESRLELSARAVRAGATLGGLRDAACRADAARDLGVPEADVVEALRVAVEATEAERGDPAPDARLDALRAALGAGPGDDAEALAGELVADRARLAVAREALRRAVADRARLAVAREALRRAVADLEGGRARAASDRLRAALVAVGRGQDA